MRAAAVMGQLRNALRAYAAEGHEPAAVMSRTNRLMADLDPALFATCAIVMLDLRSSAPPARAGRATRRRSCAQPTDGSSTARRRRSGRRWASHADDEYQTGRRCVLARGDTLVLFTDGLVEDSARSFDEGLAAVLTTLQASETDDLESLADRLLAGPRRP